MPILFFTQVIGLALGLSPKELGFGQEFVDAMPVVRKIEEVPPPKAKPERRSKQALPMPVMPE
jgi:heterodisulfide reductase subunit B